MDVLPAWLHTDLHKLQDDDVSKQLEIIFGKGEAHQILNPTVTNEPDHNALHPVVSKHETQDAHAFWNSLRGVSQKKLLSQTSPNNNDAEYIQRNMNSTPVLFNYKNNITSRRVNLYRQRFQLMHKVAHINEEKTRQLLDTVKLPALTPSSMDYSSTTIGLNNRGGEKHNNGNNSCVDGDRRMETSKNISRVTNNVLQQTSHGINSNNVGLNSNSATCENSVKTFRFLSEDDCRASGRFTDRMKRLGIHTNIGIGTSQIKPHQQQSLSAVDLRDLKDCRSEIFDVENKRKVKTCESWGPLSLAALAEYTSHIDIPRVGEFKSGRMTFWEPKVSSVQSEESD